jgi:hypothetical protein
MIRTSSVRSLGVASGWGGQRPLGLIPYEPAASYAAQFGAVTERLNVLDLKSNRPKGLGGSNPPRTAYEIYQALFWAGVLPLARRERAGPVGRLFFRS